MKFKWRMSSMNKPNSKNHPYLRWRAPPFLAQAPFDSAFIQSFYNPLVEAADL